MTKVSLSMLAFCMRVSMFGAQGGTLTSTPSSIDPSSDAVINYDGTGTNFANWEPKCHIHAWLVAKDGETFSTDSYSTAWATCEGDDNYNALEDKVKMTLVEKGKYTITVNIKSFFNVANEDLAKIAQLGIIVRTQYYGTKEDEQNNNKTNNFLLPVALSTDPAVALTVTGDTKLGSEVTLSAAASNIEGEVSYKYYVKVGDGEFTALEADKYTFEAFGTYTFKVEALVGTDVKAESTKAVTISADWYVRGSFTGWEVDIKYGMPKNAEGVYSLSFKLEAGTYSFKLSKVDTWTGAIGAGAVNADCSDQGWEGDVENNGNITFTLNNAATVTVTYDGEKICLTSTLGQFGKVVITSYTIVGDSAIVGKDWAPTYANADMTDKGDGTWVWEIKDSELEATDYNYKVVGNHAYAIYQFPTDDGNQTLAIAEAGTYDIVYTFKPGETPELSAVATKHSSPVTGLQESVAPVLYTRDGRIYGADDMRIYTVLGLDVTNMNGQLNGIYVVKTQAGIVKVVVR